MFFLAANKAASFTRLAKSAPENPGVPLAIILESNLGINPQIDGAILRLPIPKLSEERRNELSKIASQYAENSKISIRNIRRDFIESKKNEKKESIISEDDLKKYLNEAQKYTDNYISNIEKILEQKKADILKV